MRRRIVLASLLCAAFASANPDSLEFTLIHTKSSNWLATTLHPLTGCQEVVVDSFWVRADDTAGASQTQGATVLDLHVWWRVQAAHPAKDALCKLNSQASRRMSLLPEPLAPPPPRDTVFVADWILGKVYAHGPSGREDTVIPVLVDQAGTSKGFTCPVDDCAYEVDPVVPPLSELKDSLRSHMNRGGAVLVATSGGAAWMQERGARDSASVAGLGLVSPWSGGDRFWREVQPVSVLSSWGPQVPRTFLAPTGRKSYQWTGTASSGCAAASDELCDAYPTGSRVVYSGGDVTVSNDSTANCTGLVDLSMGSVLAQNWMLLVSRREVDSAFLFNAFHRASSCPFARAEAFPVVNDSVQYRGGRYALEDLSATLAIHPRSQGIRAQVRSVAGGWNVATAGLRGEIRLLDVSGRILFRAVPAGDEIFVPAPRRGAFLLQAANASVPLIR